MRSLGFHVDVKINSRLSIFTYQNIIESCLLEDTDAVGC